MRRLESTTIDGASGTAYDMNRYPADMRFNDFIAAVYILFADDKVLHVGHSDNIDFVLQKNKVAESLAGDGLSSIGVVRMGSPGRREQIVADLSEALSPSIDSITQD